MGDARHDFDEALISGYLDGELTQQDEQMVRLHLEDCADCRSLEHDMQRLRKATMTTEFNVPEDAQWDESPRSGISGWFRRVGWLATIVWAVALTGWLVWLIVTETENWFEASLWFGAIAGAGLLFLSVLFDRIRDRRTDPYRKVEK